MSGVQGGSKTSSIATSATDGIRLILRRISIVRNSPMPQPGGTSGALTARHKKTDSRSGAGNGELEETKLELGGLGQHAHIPRGIKDQLDFSVLYRRNLHQLVLDFDLEDLAHATAGCGERHFNCDLAFA